jgi:hypothetical protein
MSSAIANLESSQRLFKVTFWFPQHFLTGETYKPYNQKKLLRNVFVPFGPE